MYTTRSRTSERISFAGSGKISGATYAPHFSTPLFLEGVYSWRTGSSNSADPPGTPPVRQRRQDGWGIITPTNRGSLVHRLADRKRYMEEFQRAMFPAETDAGGFSTNRVSTTDTGHLFGSLKVLRKPYIGRLTYSASSVDNYVGDTWASVEGNAIYNSSPYTFGFPTNSASPLVVSPTGRQATANRYFTASAPDKAGASIGVTLIELLRGDVPSLLKNFRNMMAGYQTVRNYVGSDALNIMFGWTPLIQEYANLIRTGMALERVVYYESFRRKRQWDGPTYRQETTPKVTLGNLNGPFLSSTLQTSGDVVGPSSGIGVQYDSQREIVAVEDYHFSSRYTGLAKAGRRANSFSDQAMDVFKRMGVIDDPNLIWDLTPYSWLVDWFTTMGDSLTNAQTYAPYAGKYSVDYAYLTTQHVVSVKGQLLRKSGTSPSAVKSTSVVSASSSLICTSKWRSRATPFGFGTQLGSLNATQFAILVALGFAKTR